MSRTLVSVVIPTYSRPTFLKRCIESVQNQSHSDLEIIVVDDNNPYSDSRKATEEIMSAYENDKRIKYYKHQRNKNGAAARNTGWKYAKGVYITFLDDDDVIAPTKIQKQVECLEALDETWGACYTGYCIVKEKGENQTSSECRSGHCYIDALMRTLFMGSGSNLLLRKSVVDEINGYDESFQRNQDIEFLARALEHYKLAYVDEVLLTIYQEGNRAIRSFDQLDDCAKHYLEKFNPRIESLKKNDRERVIAVISLERCRVAFYKREFAAGVRIIRENHVGVKHIFKYLAYLSKRAVTHKSYGFVC